MNSPLLPLLEGRGITIWRGDKLLVNDVDVNLGRAGVLQIQGSNGSGKTTLLRALIGLADIDEGAVLWCGQPVSRVREDMHNSLLYLGHKLGISGGLTPCENLLALCPELGQSVYVDSIDAGSPKPVSPRDSIAAVLGELGIADRIDLPSVALSAGQQRRVALARLRLQHARLWVLDEPLTSLDADGYAWVRAEIEKHVRLGGAVIFTTHQSLAFDSLDIDTLLLAGEI